MAVYCDRSIRSNYLSTELLVGNFVEAMSVHCWHRRGDQNSGPQTMIGSANSASSATYLLQVGDYQAAPNFSYQWWNSGSGQDLFTRSFEEQKWRSVGVTRSGTTSAWNINMYVDGANEASGLATRNPHQGADTYLGIGRWGAYSGTNEMWTGYIEQVALWDAELTELEMQILAGGVIPTMVRPESLRWYFPLTTAQGLPADLINGDTLTPSAPAPVTFQAPNLATADSPIYISQGVSAPPQPVSNPFVMLV